MGFIALNIACFVADSGVSIEERPTGKDFISGFMAEWEKARAERSLQ